MPTPIIVNPMIFRELSLEDSIRKALAMGFDQVEVWRGQLQGFRTRDLRHQLRDFVASLGSTISGLNSCDMPYCSSSRNPRWIVPRWRRSMIGPEGGRSRGVRSRWVALVRWA